MDHCGETDDAMWLSYGAMHLYPGARKYNPLTVQGFSSHKRQYVGTLPWAVAGVREVEYMLTTMIHSD